MISRRTIGDSPLQIGGAFIAVFSLVGGLLVLFVIPSACTFVGSLELLALGFLFVIGVLAFIVGKLWFR